MKRHILFTSILILFIIFNNALLSQTFPAGFNQVKVASITDATAMRFCPDGRIFVAQRDGTIKIIKNGALLSTPFLKLTTDQNGERGVSGICFDPNFNSNHYVYIYYTATTPTIHNRLSRFTANGDVAVSGSEFALLEGETVTQIYHNGGGLEFGKDGMLYLSMGEDNKPNNAQDLTTYKGKLLRIEPDGSAPPNNPYSNSTNEVTKRIWCMGLRNPYTLAVHPVSGRIFINNVGSDYWEEIHDGTASGQNFGWPYVEGTGSDPAYKNPIFAYPHDATGQHGCAITGGTFFNPTSTNYPSEYIGKYFYMEFCNGWMSYLTPTSTSYTGNTTFATGLTTQNLALQVGIDGNLYYLNRYDTKAGVWKIIYNNNNPPAISMQPGNVTVAQGQSATFSVSATGASPLSYQWRKNGTNITGATNPTYTIASAASSDAGQYSVNVSNAYGSVISNSATLTVTSFNTPPHATILTPATNSHYRAGDVISFSGNASDSEDGALAASKFEWTVEFWHNNNHYHPGPYIPTGIKSGTFTIPNTGESSPIVFYRLKLKVTDSNGLIDTQHVDILPLLSTITMNTVPAGLQVTYDGQPKATTFSTQAVRGMLIPIGAPTPQSSNSVTYNFDHWQQGGANPHSIKIGESDSVYNAIFNNTSTPCSATGTITRDYWANIQGSTVSSVPVNSAPTSTSALTIFEGPSNVADNYGSRIRGYICPPATGNYTFWIASDNGSELWLSTTSNPLNKIKIASVPSYTAYREWTKYPEQQSTPVYLTAGTKYYIEAIHKEGTQGDNLSVGWKLPDGTLERPIPGSRLSPFTTSGSTAPTVSITSPGNGATFGNPSNITITANASTTSGTIVKVEFFEGTNKIGEDLTAPYSYTWMNVTTGNYSLKAIATNSIGTSGTSVAVNISVASCQTPIITASGPTTMCSGSVILKTNAVAGNIYQWKKDGVNISGATSSSYTVTASGQYQVKVIEGSCITWSAPTTVKIQSGLSASITPSGPTTFCSGGHVILYANTCTDYSYQWKKDGSNISGANSSTFLATATGSYQVMITQAGVNAWSALTNVQVNNCVRDDAEDNNEIYNAVTTDNSNLEEESFKMKVYPNPTNGLFTIQLSMPTLRDSKVNMRVVNMLGQQVYAKDLIAQEDYLKETVELSESLKTGVYTLQIIMDNKIESTNIILAK